MLAGLAAQTLTVGTTQTAWAFATTIIVFTGLLMSASIVVSLMKEATLRPIRMTGPGVKRWSGYVLMAVGFWFMLTTALPGPILLS